MSLPHKAADVATGVSVVGGVAGAVHWFFGDLAPVQVVAIILAIVAGIYAIRVHRKNLRK
jgi:hypothetical protein